MTPNGHAGTQYPHPLQMSSWTTTVPNSVRKSEPVGHTSRQAAWVQCLQTSELISQRRDPPRKPPSALCAREASSPAVSIGSSFGSIRLAPRCSTNATWRHEFAPSSDVLSYDSPVHTIPSSGTRFHSLQATSQALQPMQTEVSVKKPTGGSASRPYVSTPSAVFMPKPPASRGRTRPAPAGPCSAAAGPGGCRSTTSSPLGL